MKGVYGISLRVFKSGFATSSSGGFPNISWWQLVMDSCSWFDCRVFLVNDSQKENAICYALISSKIIIHIYIYIINYKTRWMKKWKSPRHLPLWTTSQINDASHKKSWMDRKNWSSFALNCCEGKLNRTYHMRSGFRCFFFLFCPRVFDLVLLI